MATCERCNNLLPRTVDQCPVCGLLIATQDDRKPEFDPPAAPGWATPSPTAGNHVDPFSQSPVWGGTEQPNAASSPSTPGDHTRTAGGRPPAQQSSLPHRREPTDQSPPDDSSTFNPPPYEPPPYEVAAYEPPAYEPPVFEPQAYEPPLHEPQAYESPAALGASFDTPGFSDSSPTLPDDVGSIIDHPIPAPDPASYEASGSADGPSTGSDLLPPRPRPHDAKSFPQRTGHDGAPVGAGVNPIVAAPSDALTQEQTTRTVRAFSSRIEGDIKYGRSPRHNLITSGLLVLALTTFGVGAGLGVLAASATDTVQSFEPAQEAPAASGLDLDVFHETHGENVVAVELSRCGVRRSVRGVASDATTVLVPWREVKTDTTPLVATAGGERIRSKVLGWDRRTGLAVISLSETLAAGGFGWSGANQATAGTELVLLHPSGRTNQSRTIVAYGMTRNNDGIPGTIVVNEEQQLDPYAFAATESGQLIGVVSPNGRTIIASDVLRTMAGSIKADPSNPRSECPPPPKPAGPEEAPDGAN